MLKKRILKKKIKAINSTLEKRTPIIKAVQKVAILNNPDSVLTLKQLRYLKKSLQLNSTNFVIFNIKKNRNNYKKFRSVVVSIDSFGNIKSPEITTLLNKKYDLLIDFTKVSNAVEKYISLAIQADFRVGHQNEEEIYDLMIVVKDNEIKLFIDEMMRYLKIIGIAQ